jgi:hypothetical protein
MLGLTQYLHQVRKLAAMWQRYAERADVLPLDGRPWDEHLKNPVNKH